MSTPDSKIVISLETLLKGLDPTVRGLNRLEKQLKTLSNVKPSDTAQNFNRTTAASERQAQQIRRLSIASAELDARQKRLETTNLRNATAMDRARLAAQRLEQQKAKLNQTSVNLEKSLSKVGSTLNRIGSGISSAGRLLTVALTAPLTAIGVLATKNAVEFDSLRRGLEVMAGSADEAGRQLARLREIAKAPGIGFQEAIQGSIRLQAVGFSAEVAEKALVQFANAVALTGGGREELSRITVQLGQLAAKGKVVAQDLKPIIEAGPAVGQALLQAFGTVNSEDIQKLGLSSEEFINKLLEALAKLPRAAAGAKNAFENFTDSIFVASIAIGDAILPPLTKLITTLEPIILGLADSFKNLSPGVQTAVVAVAALAAAAGPLLLVLGSLVTAVGTIVSSLGAIAGVVAAIGFPELLLILAGLAIQLTVLATAAFAVFKAWQANFLGIQGLVSDAAQAVLGAFNRIRVILNEATQRILPTLQSITTKVLAIVTAAWQKYGKDVVAVVGAAFKFATRVVETFISVFGDIIDLLAKLIDGDFRGAWAAFARIVVVAVDAFDEAINKLPGILLRAFFKLIAILLAESVRFLAAGEALAAKLVAGIAIEIVRSAPTVRDAIVDMFILAAQGFDPASIAGIIVGRFIASLRKAAAERLTGAPEGPNVGADVGFHGFLKRKRGSPPPSDKATANALRKAQDDFEKAQNEFIATQAQNRIAIARAGIQQQFDLTKDGLDRELETLKANFDLRLVSVRKYFDERRRLQESEIDAELTKEKALTGSLTDEFVARRRDIENEFQATVDEINRDPKLKGHAKTLQIQTAEQKKQTELGKAQTEFETQNAEIATRILILQKKRKDVTADLTREEAELVKQLQKQEDALKFDLLEEQGRSADAITGRLKQQFKDTLEDLHIDVTALVPELQTALNDVDLTTLQTRLQELPQPVRDLIDLLDIGIKRAQIFEQSKLVGTLQTELGIREDTIQQKVLDGVISERQARAEIVALQQKYKGLLLDILAGELAKAQAIQDQDEIGRIEGQINAVKRLGIAIDEVGVQINQSLFSDLESGLGDIFISARKGLDGIAQAAKNLGLSLLDSLNRLAAKSLVEKIFTPIFKPDAESTKGTPGGFLSKIFGLSPKASGAAALSAAGTTAGTALTTGGTAAASALTTGAATAGASLVASITSAAAAFAASVAAAGATFAASVGVSGAAQGIGGGLGSALGAAATGMFPAVPGGAIHFVEGGFPEAILTTDPRHAARQVQILKSYLKQTKGLFGRIPGFAEGGIISPRQTEMDLLGSINRAPSLLSNMPDLALAGPSAPSVNLRNINMIDRREMVRGYLRSAEGTRDIINVISENAPDIGRRIGVNR